jgi:hypothetical protein
MLRRVLHTLFIFLALVSCHDEAESPDDSISGEPAVTEIGIPIDNPVTAQIGPSGGSLSSKDGKLTITVPTNAVNANTTFSIQPIISFCPGGTAAFRLLPEGLTFSTPVTLTFHYTAEEMEGTSPEFLGIAYQGSDKIWYRLPAAVVDASAKTISVPVKHFTDWAVLDRLTIEPHEPEMLEVKAGETITLYLDGAEDLPPLTNGPAPTNNPSPDEDELPPLPPRIPFVAKWSVNGVLNGNVNVGKISQVASGSPYATYTAPETVPANNPVQISAELTRFRFWDRVNRRMISFNDVILFKRILIKPDEYNFRLELEAKTDHACGLPGQNYSDRFEMDIKVLHGIVTVSDTTNHVASVSPSEVGFGDCTLTCTPGPTGIVNVKEVEGTVSQGPKGETLFLILKYRGATSIEQTIECPDSNPSFAPYKTFESSYSFEFLLSDTTQVKDDGPNGYWIKLTPR